MAQSRISTWSLKGLSLDDKIPVDTGTGHAYINSQGIINAVKTSILFDKNTNFTKAGTWLNIDYIPNNGKYLLCRGDTTNRFSTSSDLTTYTDIAVSNINCTRSAYGAGKLVLIQGFSTTDSFKYTTDGVTFTNVTLPDAHVMRDVKFITELNIFVAVASAGSARVYTSADGITWTARTGAPLESWYSVTYDSALERLVIVGRTGTNRIAYTTDFTNFATWTGVNVGATLNLNYTALAFGASLNMLQAVNINKATIANMYSTNGGATWTAGTLDPLYDWRELMFIDEIGAFVALSINFGGTGSVVAVSNDGFKWKYYVYDDKYNMIKWVPTKKELLFAGESDPNVVRFTY